MIQHHKYSLTEIENMMPWERDVYVALLKQYIEEENLKRQQSNSQWQLKKHLRSKLPNSWMWGWMMVLMSLQRKEEVDQRN